MSRSSPMPADFSEHATETIRELITRYGVTQHRITAWRRELGIKLPPGAPRGNRNSGTTRRRRKETPGMDDADAIQTCLSCTRERCSGQCRMVH